MAEYRQESEDIMALIGASIGPIRYSDEKEEMDVREEYKMIFRTMYDSGIRIFILETFDDWRIVKWVA